MLEKDKNKSASVSDNEPDTLPDFDQACETVLRTGIMMTSAGTGAYRVKEAMNRVGLALGLNIVHAEVTLNTVMMTCYRGKQNRSLIGTIPVISVNAGRIGAMETLSLSMRSGMDLKDINSRLAAIARLHGWYGRWVTTLAAMAACGSFCFLNNGGWVECLGAAIGAGAGQFLRVTLRRKKLNQLGVALLAGTLASIFYLGLTALLLHFGIHSPRHEAGYTSAVLFLIPGFPLITAGLDLARSDLTAGISRLTYAILLITVASISSWLVAWLVHLTPQAAPELELSAGLMLFLRLLASFCGVYGFATMFNTPVRVAFGAALIGMVANTIRLYLVDFKLPLQMAAPCVTLLVGLLASWASPRLKCPRITLSVPAVLIMIPGALAYRALVYANLGMSVDALTNACQTIFIVAGIVMGLAIARMLTDNVWSYEGQVPGFDLKKGKR